MRNWSIIDIIPKSGKKKICMTPPFHKEEKGEVNITNC